MSAIVACPTCKGRGCLLGDGYPDDCPACDGASDLIGSIALPLTAKQASDDTCRWGELRDFYNPAGVPDLDELNCHTNAD